MSRPEWLRIALEPATVRRGLGFAVVVGALLITINHGDAVLSGDIDTRRLARMALTALVPYLVSTFSTVGARLERKAHRREGPSHVE